MIQKISGYWIQQLEEYQLLTYDKDVHQYGLEVMISTLIDFLLIIFIGCICHHVFEALIFYVTFALIRKFSGGFHFDTYAPCILTHIFIWCGYLWVYPYIYRNVSMIVAFISWIVFIQYVPVIHKNKMLNEQEQKRYRYIAMLLLLGYCLLMMTPIRQVITYTIMSVCFLIMICMKNYEK